MATAVPPPQPLGTPEGIAFGPNGKIYVSEGAVSPYSETIRLLTPTGGTVNPPPAIGGSGVISASGFGGGKQVSLSGWVEIYGSYFSGESRQWAGSDFNGSSAPTRLDSTSVTIGGQPAYISYISPGQVNAQVPSGIGTGAQNVVLTTAYGSTAPFAVTVNPEQPGLLAPSSFDIDGAQYVVATFPDGTFALPPGAIPGVASRLARPGDALSLWGIGFGPVSPAIPAGRIVNENNNLSLQFQISLDGSPISVTYAGLAPDAIGLYQINIAAPNQKFGGKAILAFSLAGVTGNQSLILAAQ